MAGVVLHGSQLIVRQSQGCDFYFTSRRPIFAADIEPLSDPSHVGRFRVTFGFVHFSPFDLKIKSGFGGSSGFFFGLDSLMFSTTARGLSLLPVSLFRTHLGFDFGSYTRFKFGALEHVRFGPQPAFFFSLQPRLNLSLPASFLFGDQSGGLLSLTADFFVSAPLGFFSSQATSMFSREFLRFLFRAKSSLFFGLSVQSLFGLAALLGFSSHLSFNFSPQACFFLRAALGFSFSLTAGRLFVATTLCFFSQAMRLCDTPQSCGFTSLHALDLFRYCSEAHFSATAHSIFIRFFPGFNFQVTSLYFGPVAGLSFFRFAQSGQFSFVRLLRPEPLVVDFGASGFLHRAHPPQLLFDPHEFLLCCLPAMFFRSLLASFDFDSFSFFLSAPARGFFFHLAPAFLLGAQSIARSHARDFHFSPARFLFGAQPHQLSVQLGDLRGVSGGDGVTFSWCGGGYCRNNRLWLFEHGSRIFRSIRSEIGSNRLRFSRRRRPVKSVCTRFRSGLFRFEYLQEFGFVS
jgi:hypothetical protein